MAQHPIQFPQQPVTIYHIFPNQPQNKHSQASYIFFPLPPPSPNTLSSAYLKHNLLSHWFLLCKLPTHYTSPADALLHHRKHLSISVHKTLTNLPTGITGTHQRNSGRSRACFQTNSWTRRYMNLPTYIIGMEASFEHQPATQTPQVGKCLPSQLVTRLSSTKKSWLLICKQSKGIPVLRMVLVPFFMLNPYLASEENKSDIHSFIAYFMQWFPVWFGRGS